MWNGKAGWKRKKGLASKKREREREREEGYEEEEVIEEIAKRKERGWTGRIKGVGSKQGVG
jgi:hypothetical protein